MDKNKAMTVVIFLDQLLDDDTVHNALLHRNLDTSMEDDLMLAATASRQWHSRPASYSEEWVSKYTDEDFKAHFRLSRDKFEYVLTTVVAPEWQMNKKWCVEPRKALEITLWYLATQVIVNFITSEFRSELMYHAHRCEM